MSNIEWTQETWNPIVGCSMVSPGCTNCYAMTMARWQELMGNAKYAGLTKIEGGRAKWTGKLRFDEEALLKPLKRKKSTTYFVNSMSDLFHEDAPDEWLDKIFAVMALTPQHTYQVLTKRPERMREFCNTNARICMIGERAKQIMGAAFRNEPPKYPLKNVWLGVSAENQEQADARIPILLDTPAAVRFVSAEPLLAAIDFGEWIYGNGRGSLRSCASGRVGDSAGWNNLAQGSASRGQAQGRLQNHTLHSSSRREAIAGRLPYGSPDEGGAEVQRPSASLGLPPYQRPDPGRDDDQSQERQEGRQSPGEFGAGHLLRTVPARAANLEEGAHRPVRNKERYGDADLGTSRGNTDAQVGGAHAKGDSGSLRSKESMHFSDSTGAAQISWLIVGGESGHGARPCDVQWIRSIVQQCKSAGVPVFVKQLGARPCCSGTGDERIGFAALTDSKGGDPAEWPADLRVREMPEGAR